MHLLTLAVKEWLLLQSRPFDHNPLIAFCYDTLTIDIFVLINLNRLRKETHLRESSKSRMFDQKPIFANANFF